MLKKFTKLFIIPALIFTLTVTALPASVHAQTDGEENPNVSVTITPDDETSDEELPLENIGVSPICPDIADNQENQIQPFSIYYPTKVWNIKSKGKYSFSGSQSGDKVINYTNYKFKGKNNYTFKVTNKGPMALTVKALRKGKTYATTKISRGKSATVQFSNIYATTEFWLSFQGVASFTGYVK